MIHQNGLKIGVTWDIQKYYRSWGAAEGISRRRLRKPWEQKRCRPLGRTWRRGGVRRASARRAALSTTSSNRREKGRSIPKAKTEERLEGFHRASRERKTQKEIGRKGLTIERDRRRRKNNSGSILDRREGFLKRMRRGRHEGEGFLNSTERSRSSLLSGNILKRSDTR